MQKFSYKRKRLQTIIFSLLLCILLFTGCRPNQLSETLSSPSTELLESNEEFDEFLTDIFKQLVTSDALSFHYTLKTPSHFDLESVPCSFGSYSELSFQNTLKQLTSIQKQLASFSKETLSTQQQQDYDILSYYLEESLEGTPYLYYETILSPVIGLQAQLPILLSEYRLESKEDIKDYLSLLSDLDRYLKEIVAFEEIKAEKGFGMQDFAIEDIQTQCNNYLSATDTNCLISSFENRLSHLLSSGILTEEEQQEYCIQNTNKVLQEILPAYESFVSSLDNLKGKATIDGGLVHLKNGSNYYEYLVKSVTGSPLSPEEIQKQIHTQMKEKQSTLLSLLQENPNILEEYETTTIPMTDPNEMLSTLQQKLENSFPKAPTTSYELKTVDPSLSEHLSPAFYLTPPIDDIFSNVIYINRLSSSYDSDTLYPTLAHEGYPGHLYQNTYFYSTNPNPIRSLLNFEGYSEGWATYVEYHCYEEIDYDKNASAMAQIQQYEMDLSLGLCSLIDIGVNYEGWDLEQCSSFLSEHGITDSDTALSLYHSVIEEPANYLKYYASFLQFESLRKKAMDTLQDDFDPIQFHKIILDLGPAPFPIVEEVITSNLF